MHFKFLPLQVIKPVVDSQMSNKYKIRQQSERYKNTHRFMGN